MLLDIKGLTVHYITDDGTVHAVNDLDLQVARRKCWPSWRNRRG